MTTRMYRKAVLAVSLGLGLSFASQAYAAEITLYAVVDQQAQPPQVTVQAVFPSPDAPVPKGVVVGSNFFDATEILFLNGYTVSNPIAAAGGSPPEPSEHAVTAAPRSTRNLNRFQAVLLTPTGEIGIIRNLFHSEVFPPHELIMIGVLNPQAPDFAVLAVMTSTGALLPVLGDADVPAATQILVNAGYVSIQPNEELAKRLDQIQAEQPSSLQVATLPQGDIGFLRSMSRPPDPGLPGNPPLEVLLTGVADLVDQVILTTGVLTRTGFSLPQLTGKFLDDTRILKLLGLATPRTFLVANSPDIGSIPAPPPARELSVVITAAGEIAVVRSFFRPALVLPGPPLAVCPCDYLAEVPLTKASWDLTHPPVFQCPETGQISVIADNFKVVPCDGVGSDLPDCDGVQTSVVVQIFATPNTHLCSFADLDGPPGFGTAIFGLTDAEALVCRQKVIDYGNALQSVASTEGFAFIDNCPE